MWDEIWNKKGLEDTNDLNVLSGFDMYNDKKTANVFILKRKRQYSKRKKLILNRTKKTLTVMNGWILCLCFLAYIYKKKDTEGGKNNKVTLDTCSYKKSYIPPLSFKKLWTEELSKYS